MTEKNAESPDNWDCPKKILVILAHPDDPEFFCGGSLVRWAQAGHEIYYFILTNGDKGGDPALGPAQLREIRHSEQLEAAKVIGVSSVDFLDLEDGELLPSIDLRQEVVRMIRKIKPDILVTCDPTNLFPRENSLNHADHRYAGQVVLDAVFPAAGNIHFFPELLEEGLMPHMPREIWISLTCNSNVTLDVTGTWDQKLAALKEHKSQIGDLNKFEARMRSRRTEDSTDEHPRFEEKFRVLKFA